MWSPPLCALITGSQRIRPAPLQPLSPRLRALPRVPWLPRSRLLLHPSPLLQPHGCYAVTTSPGAPVTARLPYYHQYDCFSGLCHCTSVAMATATPRAAPVPTASVTVTVSANPASITAILPTPIIPTPEATRCQVYCHYTRCSCYYYCCCYCCQFS